MFERFTNRARHVVVLSQEEARLLKHNYIGTEHILLGLIGEPDTIASQALARFDMSLDGTRDEVRAVIGLGKAKQTGHIPFTPRAKKVLELALREALRLNHNFIGTEHILLGLIREGDGVGAQIIKQHCADLSEVRAAVLDLVSTMPAEPSRGLRWLRDRTGKGPERRQPAQIRTTPAADTSLTEAARLAGSQPVGSHHLLLAALADPESAASRALTAFGVTLEPLKEVLRKADVTGTSDEQPEEAGRRQMVLRVSPQKVTVEATDAVILRLGQAAAGQAAAGQAAAGQAAAGQAAAGGQGDETVVIQGDMPIDVGLSNVWRALHDSLEAIHRHAEQAPDSPGQPDTEAS